MGGMNCRLGDKDVRDKNGLTDARATIERRMEKFKECEKDMKVKNFSKIGLDRGTKQDPRRAAILDCIEWLKQTIDALNTKVCLINLANMQAAHFQEVCSGCVVKKDGSNAGRLFSLRVDLDL
jgi:CCR4-NOT transcriptional regulation complex NOT5 subunit